MGCDGGTIPRRDELVRVQKKPEKKDKESDLAFKWRHCNITQLPLKQPIVACGLGRLYSKESVLEGLLDRSMLPESAKHIKKMRDIKDLKLTDNPAFSGDKAKVGDCYEDMNKSPFICPVTGIEMNGKHKFMFLWNCGCVVSQRAMKEVKTSICHVCQKPFEKTDIIILNAEDDDFKQMQENLLLRKANKKSKRIANGGEGTSSDQQDIIPSKKIKKEDDCDEGAANKKKKTESKILNRPDKPEDPSYFKASADYSVAKDSSATDVYKSLFTTHKSAQQQQKAHWVTYNPFYN